MFFHLPQHSYWRNCHLERKCQKFHRFVKYTSLIDFNLQKIGYAYRFFCWNFLWLLTGDRSPEFEVRSLLEKTSECAVFKLWASYLFLLDYYIKAWYASHYSTSVSKSIYGAISSLVIFTHFVSQGSILYLRLTL